MTNDHKLILLFYRSFAGGNFLANMLCHNPAFVPKFVFDPSTPRYNSTDLVTLTDDQLFDMQLELLKTTIPDAKEQAIDWWRYELGCGAFWAKDFNTYIQFEDSVTWANNLRPEPFELMARNKFCFIVAHNIEQYSCIKQAFPNSIVIQLVNDDNFRRAAIKIKHTRSWVREPALENLDNAIHFDIDSIWQKELFFDNVTQILERLNVTDKTLANSAHDYYNRYITLHKNI